MAGSPFDMLNFGDSEKQKDAWQRLADPGGLFAGAPRAEIRGRDPGALEAQNLLMGQLGQWAQGQGPSAAADQMRLGSGYGSAQAMGMAAGQTGISPAQAARMAQMAGMEQRARANEQAGILRAKEQQAAMQMYADAVNQANAMDLQEMQILAQLEAQNAQTAQVQQGGFLSAAGGLIGGLI